MECNIRSGFKILILQVILVLSLLSRDANGFRRLHRPRPGPNPPPLVKVGNGISLNVKPSHSGAAQTQTVDIAPLLRRMDEKADRRVSSQQPIFNSAPRTANNGQQVMILRRKSPSARNLNMFRTSSLERSSYAFPRNLFGQSAAASMGLQQNRRSFDTDAKPPMLAFNKAKLAWMAMHAARLKALKSKQSQHYGLNGKRKPQFDKTILPLLYRYKMQKQAAAKEKYLKALHLLALSTSPDLTFSSPSELVAFAQSFKNSPYSSLLNNSSFVSTNSVKTRANVNSTMSDQIAEASERSDPHHHHHDHDKHHSHLHREYEKQKRKLLEVFPPPQSEIPFGERTILMVRFPPVPEHHDKNKDWIKIKTEYDIDGGITFGGPRWMSFGHPFDPFDHPWDHTTPPPKETKLVLAEADKPSSYGVIITQNFIHRPSIRFTNSDPKLLAKNQGDILNGGPSIVAQLAKALAEGNRISNSYYLSKNAFKGKTWANPEKKPPFVIVHLDTYTKKSNETGNLGLDEDVEANYANGTIIYPTINNPHILASTKFEFHDTKEIDHIFDRPLGILGHGYGWGEVPVYPKGINEIRNFLRLMYKVHQEAHAGAKTKAAELKKIGDGLERPGLIGSKPLLRDQIADRSVNWLHTSSVGIRSLSQDDDHFPYAKHPVVDVSKDYEHFFR